MENIENNTGFERFLDQVIAPIHVVSETCRSRSKAIVTETETGEVAFPTPKEMYESTKEAMSHAYGATYKLLMRMHDEEVVDGYHMRNLEEVYKAEEKALFEKFSAFQKFFEIPENLKE